MTGRSNREVVEAYGDALKRGDFDAAVALLDPDVTDDYPQSGERIRGRDAFREVLTHYPGGEIRTARVDRIVGSDDKWIVTPMYTSLRVDGSGDEFTAVAVLRYPDDSEWFLIQLIRMRDGAIHRLTSYFAPPFEAPDWRKPFVETIPADEVGR
jgi:ketosteroid isomerase-like protein